ncbi:MAG: response regulator [Phycisphaerales bacterium JB039]
MRRAITRTAKPASPPDDGAGIRVLCVDDHAVLIEGLKAQFSLDPSIRCIASLPSAEHLIAEVGRLKPDIVLLDIEMPGPDAFETADRLRHLHPGARVVILSAHIRDGYIDAAFKCGAWGYFAKSDDLTAIVSGIREVARGRAGTFVLGPKVKERCRPVPTSGPDVRSSLATRGAADPLGGGLVTPLSTLSTREMQVLRLIGKGLSRHQIAKQLCREVKTIDGHQARIMRKLGIKTRSDLMRLAIREGLAEA